MAQCDGPLFATVKGCSNLLNFLRAKFIKNCDFYNANRRYAQTEAAFLSHSKLRITAFISIGEIAASPLPDPG
jgi:hypothetical protein